MSKASKKRALQIQYIEWEDHVSLADSGWKDRADAHGLSPEICKSVGFLIRETPKHVILVSSMTGSQVDGEICILKNCIVKREKLK